jgi:hypothetical protein
VFRIGVLKDEGRFTHHEDLKALQYFSTLFRFEFYVVWVALTEMAIV